MKVPVPRPMVKFLVLMSTEPPPLLRTYTAVDAELMIEADGGSVASSWVKLTPPRPVLVR